MKKLRLLLLVLPFIPATAWAQNPVLRDIFCTSATGNDTYSCAPIAAITSYDNGQLSVEGPVSLTIPSPVLAASQIGAGVAAAGQAMCFNGSVRGPGNCATTGGVTQGASLTFGTIQDGGTKDLTFTFSGLTSGQAFAAGIPAGIPAHVQGILYASATDTVTVRVLNLSGGPVTLGTLTFAATIIAGSISLSSSLTFPAISDGTCSESTFSLPGALAGGAVVPGFPSALAAGLFPSMNISGAGTAQVTLCNWSGGTVTPAVQTYSAKIP